MVAYQKQLHQHVTRRGRTMTLALLAAACLSLTACLDAQRKTDMRYDPKTDEFHFVKIYYHIRGDSDGEVDYLKALYANRDHILLHDVMAFLGEDALLRLNDGTYRKFSLGDKPGQVPDAEKTPVDLAKIKIEPGKFFLSADKTLCYYQQYTIPGPVFDTILVTASEQLQTSVASTAEEELQRRAKGKTMTWDEMRTKLLASMQGPAPATTVPVGEAATQENEPGPLSVLNSDSLKILQAAMHEKAITISRKGTAFTVTVKLSPPDAAELKATWETLKKNVTERLAKETDPAVKKNFELGARGMSLVTLNDPKDGVLTASADFVKLAEFLRDVQNVEGAFVPKDASKDDDYARLVNGLKAAGVPVDETVKLDEVMPAFEKGTLPVNAPAKSVEPGEGMFNAAAGTLP